MQRVVGLMVALSALGLAGCYPNSNLGLMEKGPRFVANSQKTTLQLVECISGKWEISEKSPGRYSPRSDGALLSVDLPTMVVDIKDEGPSRRVTFYRINTLVPKVDLRRDREIEACL